MRGQTENLGIDVPRLSLIASIAIADYLGLTDLPCLREVPAEARS